MMCCNILFYLEGQKRPNILTFSKGYQVVVGQNVVFGRIDRISLFQKRSRNRDIVLALLVQTSTSPLVYFFSLWDASSSFQMPDFSIYKTSLCI